MAKFWAHGTAVSWDGTDIGGCTSAAHPSQNRGEVDTSDTDSGGVSEFIAGMLDSGEVPIEMRYDPEDSGQQALETDVESGDSAQLVITLPPGAAATSPVTLTMTAFIKSLGGALPMIGNEAASRTCVFRISSGITIDLGA